MPAPSLDRAEVALRFAVALATPGDSNVPYSEWNHGEIVRVGFMFADAFAEESARRSFTALTPPVAHLSDCAVNGSPARPCDCGDRPLPPVAPKSEAAKYEPRVGDVVRPKDERECDASWRIVVGVKPTGEGRWYISTKQRDGAPNGADHCADSDNLGYAYLRPATPEERKAAGIVEPSPEATRPTHVRITKSASPSSFKDGDVLRVVGWLGDTPSVDIDCHMGGPYVLYDSKWEPADAPKAPAPGEPAKGEARDEAYKALLAYAECDYATCYSSERDWQEVYARHGWTGGDDSYSWLRGMCVRALSLAKSALTPQVRS